MRLTPKIATAAAGVLALGGAGLGTAVAASASNSAPAAVHAAVSEPTSPDTDAIQQGDQTSPDTAAAAEATSPDTDAVQQGDQAGVDSSAAGTAQTMSATSDNPGEATSSENGPSDGPGGHADATGDVQHEFSGVE